MTFPFEALGGVSREAGLVVAVLIGIGFGFVLERAGFGRATKLAAQFYLRDMTVFKVMFTAIVTAMLGLVAAAGLGLANLRVISESIASWSYVWPMLIGGFVLGAGFIISGYCPGTSLVASASGNVDGMFAFAGVVTGTVVYSELLMQIPAVQRFHVSGEKGAWFLYDLLRVKPQILAAGIALVALAAFAGGEKVERLVAGGVSLHAIRRVAVPAFAILAAIAVLTLAVPARTSAEPSPALHTIAAADLSRAVVAEPWRFRVENGLATDSVTGRTLKIEGKYTPLVKSAPAAPAAASAGRKVIVKPKSKGGGCSS